MRMRSAWITRLIIASLVLWIGLAPLSAQEGVGDAQRDKLRQLVCEYLESGNDEQRAEIRRRIDAEQVSLELLAAVCAAPWKYEKQETGMRGAQKLKVAGQEEEYHLAVPEVYSPDKPSPLLVALHGAGGFKGDRQLDRWAPEAVKRGYIVVAPSSRQMWRSAQGMWLVLSAIRDAKRSFNVDPNRIYVTGISMGGGGTWQIATIFPDYFAGISPIAAGLMPNDQQMVVNLLHTPIYIVHGSKDQMVSVEYGRDADKTLKKLGYAHVYAEHDREKEGAGGHIHPEWEVPKILEYFDGKKRESYPKKVIFATTASKGHQSFWIRIDEKGAEKLCKVEAEQTDGGIAVKAENVKRLTVFFPEPKKDVVITLNGKKVYQGRADASAEAVLESARHDFGGGLLYKAMITLDVPAENNE